MPIDIENDDLKTALKKLQAREDNLKQLEAVSGLGSWEIDLTTKKSIWSGKTYEIYGLSKDVDVSLELFFSNLVPEDVQRAKEYLDKAISNVTPIYFECRAKHSDGHIINILINGQFLFNEDNIPIKLIGTTQDITEQVKLQQHAIELSNLLEHSSTEIYILDADSLTYLYANKGATDELGYTLDELLKMHVTDINPTLASEEIDSLKNILRTNNHLLRRGKHRRKDGTFYHMQAYIHTLKYQGKKAYALFDTDITQQVALEEQEKKTQKLLTKQTDQLRYQAHHDALTNLSNRTLFKDRLSQAIITAKRKHEQFALLFIDLDQFKKINDTLGHHIGDKVLIEVALRLQQTIREEDTLSRLGGDEFTIILKDVQGIQSASVVAQKVIDVLQEPIIVTGHTLYITASIGISIYPDDALKDENLIKYADIAMYKAKDEGRNNYQFYSAEMTAFAFERVVMESSLRVAIKEEQFIVYFQPQVEALTNNIVGMEALVRWRHPTLGIITPNKFIPIAEESGLIVAIDRIVMKAAMKQYVAWYNQGLNPGVLALNLAMKQLSQDDFLQELLENMQKTGFHPNWLELEVTETQVMHNPELSIEKLHKISEMGIEIAIDDFGTGYSSLSYLKKLPLDKLKIDQSFICDIPKDSDDVAITKAIIALGRSLKLKLIAEGVETKEQKEFLIANKCQSIQGYYYSRPIPAEEMTELLRSN